MLLYWNWATFVFIVEQEKYINSGLCVYNLKSAYLIVICVFVRSLLIPYPFSICSVSGLLLLIFTSTFFAFDRYWWLEVISTLFLSELPSRVFSSLFVCALIFAVESHHFWERGGGWWEAKHARASGPWKRRTTFIEFTQICTTRVKYQIETVQIFLILHFFSLIFVFQVVRMAYKLCLGFRLYSRL